MSQEQGAHLEIQRIYVKDISYEAPNAPHIFLGEWNPQVNLDIDVSANQLDQDLFEVELMLTSTVKVKDKVAFIIQVKQAGIFLLKDLHKTIYNKFLALLVQTFCILLQEKLFLI